MRTAPRTVDPNVAALIRARVAALRDARFRMEEVTFLADQLRERTLQLLGEMAARIEHSQRLVASSRERLSRGAIQPRGDSNGGEKNGAPALR